jgi:Tol biopolymer transport system component
MIAYQAVRNLSQGNKINNCSIMTKQLNSSAQPSVLTQDGTLPRWSPDGTRLAFLRLSGRVLGLCLINTSSGEEKQLPTGGLYPIGYSVLPYQRNEASNFDWSPDSSKIVYLSERTGQLNLWQVAADGSSDTQLTNNTDPNVSIRCPLWSADGKRIAYTSYLRGTAADGKPTTIYSVWIADAETKQSRIIFEADSYLRLIGWSPTDQGLILATLKSRLDTAKPTEVQLVSVSARAGEQKQIATLPSTYLYNIHLSADRRMVAFSSHQDEKDNIWVIPVDGGEAKKVTSNNDSRLYFSSLAWSPDGRAIYFGKQVRYSQLWMITNFE